ncbi:hypothetical protein [Streptomyces hygroscopicus]|uniref:hypothetical protein n=1 Tax=Streptomyces hygroscopicus TaxID=1912 RepID=UPI00340F12E1
MIDHDAPLTAERYRSIHNIGQHADLARLIAEHPNNNVRDTDDAPDDPTTDPDYVPNPPYDLPDGVASWTDWCR